MNTLKIEILRELPYAGNVVVEVGQKVDPDDVVAEMNFYPGLVKRLRVSEHLAISPKDLKRVVQIEEGQLVEKGQVLAFDSKWHQPQIMVAPESGIIGMVSKNLGIVYLRRLTKFNPEPFKVHDVAEEMGISMKDAKSSIIVKPNQKVVPGQIIAQQQLKDDQFLLKYTASEMFGTVRKIEGHKVWIKSREVSRKLYAYFKGTVVDSVENWSVTIESEAVVLSGNYGIAGERFGRIKTFDKKELTPDDIKSEYNKSIIVVNGKVTDDTLEKASELEIPAIISSGCYLGTIRKYVGDNFIPGITGGEEVRTGLILMNTFSSKSSMGEDFEIFKKYEGNYIAVNGTTHIRAGAIRPEILIFPEKGDN
ncbi:MAG: hypothetical protein ACLFPS_02105 [Clostridia bacterium]